MADTLKRALNAAYRLLAYRDRSVREIEDALKKKGFSAKDIQGAVEKLSALGYLDDSKFASNAGGSLMRNRKVGPAYVLRWLLKRGIKTELARRVVDELYSDREIEEKEVSRWIERKLESYGKGLSPAKKKKRVYDFLLRRGFSHDIVMNKISSLSL